MHIMPRTETENMLYSMWAKRLGHTNFGVTDDFFDVGGTSLVAIDILAELSKEYEIDVEQFFENNTIEFVAKHLKPNANSMHNKIKGIVTYCEKPQKSPEEMVLYNQKINSELTNSDIAVSQKYENILLLGATGFLGSYLLHTLLKNTSSKVFVIVRAKDNDSAFERVVKAQQYYFGSRAIKKNTDRLVCLAGDLTVENFGLAQEVYNTLLKTVDAVLNSAATVKHIGKSELFDKTNAGIVREIILFSKGGKRKAIHHISSIGIVYGEQPDNNRTVFTEYDFNVGQQLKNNYLLSKYHAEELLYEARKEGVETNIYRLSGVMFDSKKGKFQKNISESSAYVFMKSFYELRIWPKDFHMMVDISNVDKIGEAVVKLMMFSSLQNQVYHVINPYIIDMTDIMKWVGINGDKFKKMSAEEICSYYSENKDNQAICDLFKQLVFNCEILEPILKNHYNIEQKKTTECLERLGFRWSKPTKLSFAKAALYAGSVGFYKAIK